MKDEAEVIIKEFDETKKSGNEILPSLAGPDQELLKDELSTLNSKLQKVKSSINDKLISSEHDLEKLMDINELLQKSKKFILKVKAELNDLSRPLGSKNEDSQGLLGSYEVLHLSMSRIVDYVRFTFYRFF